LATRKRATSRTKSTAARRSTRRTATATTRRRTTSGSLYPRRRASRPGLPTTVGTALGTLVVTTLLDLSWPMRLLLIGVVLVLGLAYVLWRHRAEISAAAGGDPAEPTAAEETGPPAADGPPPTTPA
jgi:Flp pilus assembly protein TadB